MGLDVRQIEKNFNAALGFVPRKDIRAYSGDFEYEPRPDEIEFIRKFKFGYDTTNITDLNNKLETAQHEVRPLGILFESQDELYFDINWAFDAPDEDFDISDSVIIPPGDYWWHYYSVELESSTARPIDLEFKYRFGEFYEGDRAEYRTMVNFRMIRYLLVGLGYTFGEFSLPGGDFETRLASVRAQVNFSPDMTWFNLLQYDSVSDSIGFNSRIQWEARPGTNVFLVLNQSIDRNHGRLSFIESELTFKLGVTFRF